MHIIFHIISQHHRREIHTEMYRVEIHEMKISVLLLVLLLQEKGGRRSRANSIKIWCQIMFCTWLHSFWKQQKFILIFVCVFRVNYFRSYSEVFFVFWQSVMTTMWVSEMKWMSNRRRRKRKEVHIFPSRQI